MTLARLAPRSALVALPLAVPIAVAVAGFVVPIAYLILRAFEADLGAVQDLVLRRRNAELLRNTLVLAGGLVVTTTALALPLALLTVRSALPARRAFEVALTLPLAIPGYVGAFVILAATGPGGLYPVPRPSGFWGALLVLTLITYPYQYLSLRAALQGVDPALEESARTLGRGRLVAFATVTLPQLRPALLGGGLLVALHALADFGTVSLLRYETFSYAIYLQYSSAFDRTYAAWLALLLVALTGCLLIVDWLLLRRLRLARTGTGAPRRAPQQRLGRWAPVAVGAASLPVVFAVILPLWALLDLAARFPEGEAAGLRAAFERSLTAGATAAALSLVLAVPIAFAGVRARFPGLQVVERLAYMGYAVPPLAFALAWVFFTLRALPALYGTIPLLVFALALHVLPEAIGPVRASVRQVSPRLEESARTLGAGPLRTFLSVTVPLVWRGAAAGGALAFIGAVKELPITLILAPLNYSTLATRMFSYTQDAMFAEAAPFALAIVGVSACFVGVMQWTERTFSS